MNIIMLNPGRGKRTVINNMNKGEAAKYQLLK